MKNIVSTYVLTAAFAALAAISCEKQEKKELYSAVIPSSVEFNLEENVGRLVYVDATGSSCLPMLKGETLQLNYTMAPDNVTFRDVVWTASNPAFASVSDEGLVEAVNGDGYSVVQVAPVGLGEGSGINANLKVVVSSEMRKAESIVVTSPLDEIYAGDALQMSAAIAPENSTYRTVLWSVNDESLASIDPYTGILIGKEGPSFINTVEVTATALDGSGVNASKSVNIRKVVAPEDVSIDQSFAASNGYLCAFNEQGLTLSYTTTPAECTTSQLVWTTSDASIATVDAGAVSFKGFGKVTVTATAPATGKTSSIELNIPCGLFRETFHNPDHYSIRDAGQSGNGTSTSTLWHDGFIEITTYAQNASKQRADIKCYDTPVTIHAGGYPILAIKMEDVKDLYSGVTARNIKPDITGTSESGTQYKQFNSEANNKYAEDWKCSDGSHVFIYNFATQEFKTGGLAPSGESISCTNFQIKHADIATATSQLTFKIYWVQTFRSLDDVRKYVEDVDGLTIE